MNLLKSFDTKDTIPHPFPFSRVEKGKLEPSLSTGGEGSGVRIDTKEQQEQKYNRQVALKPDALRRFGARRSAEQGPQFYGDATVEARRRPMRNNRKLATYLSEVARVRTDD